MTSVRKGPRGEAGSVRVVFADHEAKIFANLLRNLIELLYDGMPPSSQVRGDDPLAMLAGDLAAGEGGPTEVPEDPVLARLLPDAYADDPSASADFRRLTERGLRNTKATDARYVLDRVEAAAGAGAVEIVVNRDDFPLWLKAVNDMRLALGTRLEVTEDDAEKWLTLPDDDPRRITFDLYDWLGYLQASLLHQQR